MEKLTNEKRNAVTAQSQKKEMTLNENVNYGCDQEKVNNSLTQLPVCNQKPAHFSIAKDMKASSNSKSQLFKADVNRMITPARKRKRTGDHIIDNSLIPFPVSGQQNSCNVNVMEATNEINVNSNKKQTIKKKSTQDLIVNKLKKLKKRN